MGTGTWAVQTVMDAVMTWNYDVEHPELRALYEKAKRNSGTPPRSSRGRKTSTRKASFSTMTSIPMWRCCAIPTSGVV